MKHLDEQRRTLVVTECGNKRSVVGMKDPGRLGTLVVLFHQRDGGTRNGGAVKGSSGEGISMAGRNDVRLAATEKPLGGGRRRTVKLGVRCCARVREQQLFGGLSAQDHAHLGDTLDRLIDALRAADAAAPSAD